MQLPLFLNLAAPKEVYWVYWGVDFIFKKDGQLYAVGRTYEKNL